LAGLLEEVRQLKFHRDGSGAMMAVHPSKGIPDFVGPLVRRAIREVSVLRGYDPLHLMINWLVPGTEVPVHRDWIVPTQAQPHAPTVERWHLPIQTNLDAVFWDEDRGEHHMPLGVWCGPVPYWIRHTVRNHGTTDRIHIVVDLDSPPVGVYRD
jgi:hypothetical protein